MENTNEGEAPVVPQEEQDEDITPETELSEATDWEAEAKKSRRIASRLRNQNIKLKEAKKPAEPAAPATLASKEVKPGELDYGQLAYLTANGIKEDDEVALVQNAMKETGKPLKEVIGSKYVQAELKEMREARTTKDATPSASRRASASKGDVEQWLEKPFSQVPKELRSAVLAEKEKRAKGQGPFYNS